MERAGNLATRLDNFSDITLGGRAATTASTAANGARFAAKFPLFNGIAAGAGIVADTAGAIREYKNEDDLGLAMRGVGIGAGSSGGSSPASPARGTTCGGAADGRRSSQEMPAGPVDERESFS